MFDGESSYGPQLPYTEGIGVPVVVELGGDSLSPLVSTVGENNSEQATGSISDSSGALVSFMSASLADYGSSDGTSLDDTCAALEITLAMLYGEHEAIQSQIDSESNPTIIASSTLR